MSENKDAYWKDTIGLIFKVLIVWFLISYGAGIIFADALNTISLGGYPLGFWFAQQGAIYGFVALIFIFAKLQGNIDEKHGVH